MMKLGWAFLFLLFAAQAPQFDPNANLKTGPEVGQKIPAFSAIDQTGKVQSFDSLKGPQGLVLFFNRSVDWWPWCKAQLVELGQALPQYQKLGLGVAVITYDSPEAIKDFTRRLGITVPILSDPDSKIIKSFGILNTNVPATSFQYGIPFPGTYTLDTRGMVTAKYFEDTYRERVTPNFILSRQFGEGGTQKSQERTPHLTLTSYVSDENVYAGNHVSLILDVELPPKMHIYAPGVKGYEGVEFQMDPHPNVRFLDTNFPKAAIMDLPAIKEQVPVYSGKVRITRDVVVGTDDNMRRASNVELTGTFTYQACDDKICYLETKVRLKFSLNVQNQDIPRVPANLQKR
jgi:peroxiredoxin